MFKKLLDRDRQRILKNRHFVPLRFRVPLIIICGIIFIGWCVVLMKSLHALRPYLETILILAMLLLTLVKEKFEDERVVKIREKAYTYAFYAGVSMFTLFQFFYRFSKVEINPNNFIQPQNSSYMLFVMLLCYLMGYYVLSKVE